MYLLKFFGILAVRVQGPGLTLGCDFVSFSWKHSQYQVPNFLSVVKTAATVYERDNCIGAASQTSLTGFKLRLRHRLPRTGK